MKIRKSIQLLACLGTLFLPKLAFAQTTAVVEGSLGVGENNPSARIEVNAGVAELPMILNINGARKFTLNDNGGVAIGGPFISLPTNGLYVAGSTGIGTTGPSAKLQINHDGSGSNPQLQLFESESTDFSRLNFLTSGSSDRWTIAGRTSTTQDTTLRFFHSSAGDVMVISAKDRVGIGTVRPEAKLHIKGGSDAELSDGGFLIFGETTGTNLSMDNNEIMARNNGNISTLHLQANGGDFKIHDGLPQIQEFIVKEDGKVGIGNGAPDSKLEIVGDESDGSTGTLHLSSGSQDMVLDGNEIDADEGLFLNNNLAQHVILGGGGGSVGIGTSTPDARLEIDAASVDPLRVKAGGSTKLRVFDTGGISLGTSQTAAADEIRIDVGVSSEDLFIRATTCDGSPCSPRFVPQSAGTWQLGTSQSVLDEVHANNFHGIYSPPSDRRLKENIRDIVHPLKIIQKLEGHRYAYTKEYYYDQTGHQENEYKRQNQWGLIAQEVEEVLPELVINNNENDQKALDYVSLIPILIEGIKDQQAMLNRQEKKIEELSKQMEKLRKRDHKVHQLTGDN